MGTLQEEISFFNNLYPNFKKVIQGTLDVETKQLRDEIESKTPSSSGLLARSWRVNKSRSVDVVASSSIHNPISYAEALELGVSLKNTSHPWVVSRTKEAPTTGVVASKGRVWSAKAVGGTMLTIFTPAYHQKLSRRLADAAITVFK